MADLLKQVQYIDLKSKLIVYGFIRESQDLLPFENNPYYNLNELIAQISCPIMYLQFGCLMYHISALIDGW